MIIKRVAYITDLHLDEQFTFDQEVDAKRNWNRILQDISEKGINEIVFGGDIGASAANKWFFDSLKAFNISITLGNHDLYSEVIKHYKFPTNETQNEWYYSQKHDTYKFIFLDSSANSISPKQFEWFKRELVTTKKLVLFIHHPILAIQAEVDNGYALKGRERIKAQLLNLDNEVSIFCGHYHLQDEQTIANISQYITPASSFQVMKIPNEIKISNKTFGYRIIEFNDNTLSTDVIVLS